MEWPEIKAIKAQADKDYSMFRRLDVSSAVAMWVVTCLFLFSWTLETFGVALLVGVARFQWLIPRIKYHTDMQHHIRKLMEDYCRDRT